MAWRAQATTDAMGADAVETEVLTAEEVARLLRLSAKTVRIRAGRGEIPAKKVGKVWRFIRADIEAYLRQSESDIGVSGRSAR